MYQNKVILFQVQYPLKLVGRQPANYFRKREEWRVTDMLMNPMVLMMVLPLLLIVVLPKLINTSDPELQRVRWLCSSVHID